ncbi:hypothetical protein [Enhygromyxa salina]|nr:hypothetical protein [Enhygromyxa salina]
MRTRALVLACACLGLACSSTEATPAGLLAEVDLRGHLPEGAPPVPSELDEHAASFEVCFVDDAPFDPVGLQIVWHSYPGEGGDAYIVDYAVSLTEPSKGAVVTVVVPDEPGSEIGSINLTPGAPWMEVALVVVRCEREVLVFPRKYKQSLLDQVQIVADGTVR